MTVQISKPAFNLRETLTSLKRKIGLKGAEIMKAETVDDVYNVIGTNRNLIINGDFRVSQRGTSWTNVYDYTADRWQVTRYAGSVNSVSVQDVSGNIGNPSLKKCLRVGYNGGGAGALYLNQPLDKYASAALRGKQVTLSFYVRADSVASGRTQQAGICYHTGSGVEEGMYYFNFKTQSTTNIRKSFTPTTEWQKVEFSGRLPTNVEQVGVGLIDSDYRDYGYLEFTGIQLEIGATATPFEYRPYATELALCQRYYCHSFKLGQAVAHGASDPQVRNLLAYSSNLSYSDSVDFPVPMRAAPSMVVYSPDASPTAGQWAYYDGTWKAASATNFYRITERGFNPEVNGAGFTAWQGRLCMGHWVASAEL